jgi:Asp-tRNA(Asn)/Glu-tRNA(Gln) amidotransferase A subunit family amidase
MNSKKIVIEATIKELHEAIQSGNITVTSIIEEYIDRIERFDRGGPEINSIITLNHQARKRAQQLDTTFQKSGFVGPLHGIPVLVKDQMMTKNITTTFGSEAFSSYIPDRNATIIQRIRDAGGIILGKTNLPDWAAGFVGYSSANG